jgi:hypothetical protein
MVLSKTPGALASVQIPRMKNVPFFWQFLGLERSEEILGLAGIGEPPSLAQEPLDAARRGTGDRLSVEVHCEQHHSSPILGIRSMRDSLQRRSLDQPATVNDLVTGVAQRMTLPEIAEVAGDSHGALGGFALAVGLNEQAPDEHRRALDPVVRHL